MKIALEWQERIRIRKSNDHRFIYDWDLAKMPEKPGLYVFARIWGQKIVPMYVGKALDLRNRAKNQMNNLKLMRGLQRRTDYGNRILLIGVAKLKRGQKADKVTDLAEKALIENALSQGYSLLNYQNTKAKFHDIDSSGRQRNHNPFPRKILMKRSRSE
jgi:hypothetical protein